MSEICSFESEKRPKIPLKCKTLGAEILFDLLRRNR